MLGARNDVGRAIDVTRAVLASEFFGLGCIWDSEFSGEAQSVNGNESCVVLPFNVIPEISLHIGAIEPSELLRFGRGSWKLRRPFASDECERNAHCLDTRHTPNENYIAACSLFLSLSRGDDWKRLHETKKPAAKTLHDFRNDRPYAPARARESTSVLLFVLLSAVFWSCLVNE